MRQKTLKIYWTRTTKRLISCYAVKHACVTESLRVFAVYFFCELADLQHLMTPTIRYLRAQGWTEYVLVPQQPAGSTTTAVCERLFHFRVFYAVTKHRTERKKNPITVGKWAETHGETNSHSGNTFGRNTTPPYNNNNWSVCCNCAQRGGRGLRPRPGLEVFDAARCSTTWH